MLGGLVLVIFNVYLLVHGIYTERTTQWSIRLVDYYSTKFDIGKTAIAVYKEPFKIILQQYEAQIFNCSKNDDKRHIFKATFEFNSTNKLAVIKVANTTADMSTTWLCQTKKQSGKDQLFKFKVRVTGLVHLTVGRSTLTPSPSSDMLSLNYDDISIYNYTDGMDIDMVCQSEVSDGDVRLVYYSENGTKLIKTDSMPANYSMAFRKQMRIDDNGAVVDCTYMPRNLRKYTYRILFRRKDTITYLFKITVANLHLVPTAVDEEHQVYSYQYRYFKTEKIIVSCELTINSTNISSLSFEDADMESRIRTVTTQAMKRTILLKTAKLHSKRLQCRTTSALTAYVYFRLEPVEPQILGLSASDISVRYRKNSTTWVVDYRSSADNTLTLKCVKGAWIYENNTEGSNFINLRPRRTVTTMTCAAKKNDVIKRTIINVLLSQRKLRSSSKPSSISGDASDLLFGSAAVVAISVIIVVSVIIYRRVCRTRVARQDSLAHLTREIEAPISSHPPQWDRFSNNPYQGVISNNYLYDTSNPDTAAPKETNTEDHIYHYPVVSPTNEAYAEPINTINWNSAAYTVVPSGSHVGRSLRSDKDYQTVHDVVKIKRTSEYVEPAYSVIHQDSSSSS